jgi:DNA invertase Pin-like site-specific DNA recombinase
MKPLDRLEQDDVLIVTKLNRLGRNAIDVAATVANLAEMGARVYCLALGQQRGRDDPTALQFVQGGGVRNRSTPASRSAASLWPYP